MVVESIGVDDLAMDGVQMRDSQEQSMGRGNPSLRD